MYCNECGTLNPDNGKFCSNCGAALAGQSQQSVNQQPVNQQPVNQQPQVSESNNSINGNAIGSNSYAPRVLGVISWLMMAFGIFMLRGGILAIGIDVAAIVAAVFFNKVEKAVSDEEREKTMRNGIIAFSIAAVLLILCLLILSSVN